MNRRTNRVGFTLSRRLRVDCGHSGLTLVELLVTIAVVGILAAILLAVVGSVRDRGHTTHCAANLRAIHSAHMLWAADHGGTIPMGQYDDNGTKRNLTYINSEVRDEFYAYLPPATRVPRAPESTKVSYDYAYPSLCPADGAGGVFDYFGYSYGGNGRMITEAGTPPRPQNTVARWTNPSQTMFFMDATSTFMPANSAWGSRFAGRHGGKANAVFLDGHVELLAKEDIPSPTPTTGPTASPFWNAEL